MHLLLLTALSSLVAGNVLPAPLNERVRFIDTELESRIKENRRSTTVSALPLNFTSSTERWKDIVKKGNELYEDLESGHHPDIPSPITTKELVESGWEIHPEALADGRGNRTVDGDPLPYRPFDFIGASKGYDYFLLLADIKGDHSHSTFAMMSLMATQTMPLRTTPIFTARRTRCSLHMIRVVIRRVGKRCIGLM